MSAEEKKRIDDMIADLDHKLSFAELSWPQRIKIVKAVNALERLRLVF